MKCDICGSLNTYVKEHKHEFLMKGKKIEFIALRRFCKDCNNLVYDEELDNQASKIAIQEYNKKYGINKEEIVNLRKKFNLSQSQFAKILGCAKKTLVSYENGNSIPNDNYTILLKTLMDSPEIIYKIIDANKDSFTEKEYVKINDKINQSNNLNQLYSITDFKPSEYNGYTKLNTSKVYNMILFFAQKMVLKTKLLKEMFYADFLFYKEYGLSITGLEYAKINLGPVPDQFEEIINDCTKNDLINYEIEFQNNFEYHEIFSKKNYNKEEFSKKEIEILNKVKDYFKDFTSSEIVEFSHKEKAFINTEYFKNISYDYAFDIEIK